MRYRILMIAAGVLAAVLHLWEILLRAVGADLAAVHGRESSSAA
jgi:hypothetical protein